MRILVTGAAGFVGYHVCRRLVEGAGSAEVLGLDNLSPYYDPALKQARLARLAAFEGFRFVRADIADRVAFSEIFQKFRPDYCVHLAAQAGVRNSIENPHVYAESNLQGFLNVLEACRHDPVRHLVFASSSSVYGESARTPFREDAPTDRPVSLYGATKKSNELMAASYAHLFKIRATGVRLFTVYGPWGRPDMAPVIFSRAILAGERIPLFNEGRSLRDFTFVDDTVAAIVKLLLYPAPAADAPCYSIYNVGHHRPVEMRMFVDMLGRLLGREVRVDLLPAQPGDMPETHAAIDAIRSAIGWEPKVPLETGLMRLCEWVQEYYNP
jgi:UDP-glucuronate 4-epimerase